MIGEESLFFLCFLLVIGIVAVMIWNVLNLGSLSWRDVVMLFCGMILGYGLSLSAALVAVDNLLLWVMFKFLTAIFSLGVLMFLVCLLLFFKAVGDQSIVEAYMPERANMGRR